MMPRAVPPPIRRLCSLLAFLSLEYPALRIRGDLRGSVQFLDYRAATKAVGSSTSTIKVSVNKTIAATDAALSNAVRVTFTGSSTPASMRFSNLPVRAFQPIPGFLLLNFPNIATGDSPAFSVIFLNGSLQAWNTMVDPPIPDKLEIALRA